MILNLLFGLVISWIANAYGLLPFVLSKKKLPNNPFLIILIGIAILAYLSQLFLIGGKIDSFSTLVTVIGAITIHWRYANLVQTEIKNSTQNLLNLPKHLLLALLGSTLIIAYQSAQITKINDMGMYYLQTIKWMQSFGLVNGIANLHPAYGLYSNWHSLSALFSGQTIFDIFYPNEGIQYLGLNGLLLMVGIGFLSWENYYQANPFIFVFSILFIPLGFLFLSAPSPDLPIIFYTGLILYIAIGKIELNWVIFILACFGFMLKPPALLPVFAGIIAYKNIWIVFFNKYLSTSISKKFTHLATIILLPFALLSPGLIKNYSLSGHLFYPLANQSIPVIGNLMPKQAWEVPLDWNQAYRNGIINWGNKDDFSANVVKKNVENHNFLNQFLKWVNRSGYKGVMNKFVSMIWLVGVILLLTEVIRKPIAGIKLSNTQLFFIGLTLIILTLEWFILRQYRLMLPTAISLAGLSFGNYWNKKLLSQKFLVPYFALLLFAILSFIPFHLLKKESRNKQITSFNGFEPRNLILPFHQYQDTNVFKGYCWDSPLPCQSASHKKFLFQFGYEIQALGNSSSDGYKLAPVKK
jgi:hypothetical protein